MLDAVRNMPDNDAVPELDWPGDVVMDNQSLPPPRQPRSERPSEFVGAFRLLVNDEAGDRAQRGEGAGEAEDGETFYPVELSFCELGRAHAINRRGQLVH